MNRLFKIVLFVLMLNFLTSCNGQVKNDQTMPNNKSYEDKKNVGGGCEDCDIMYVEMPKVISSNHTSIGWNEGKQKLILTGKVFQLDGKTPAKNVIIYYWHTDDKGLYSSNKITPVKARNHGKLRGWVKSDELGNYTIKTSRPAAYPSQDIAQHIHLSIKEPDIKNEYYADLYFDDDPLYLKHKKKYGKLDRAGTEILRVLLSNEIQVAEHNIVLGLNIPDYPTQKSIVNQSGLMIGEDQPSFIPYHAFGPDKGSRTCPVCKYGRFHGIIYFVGNNANWDEIKKWLVFLEQESINRSKYLKVYFVYGNDKSYDESERKKELEKIGISLNLKNMALTFVPSVIDLESEMYLNKINPDSENTFVIFRHRTIIDKFINLKATEVNFKIISNTLDKTKSEFNNLLEPKHE
nr:intradiol ring-cleavage dioxygenase [uncultured Flavobacterium sp.]